MITPGAQIKYKDEGEDVTRDPTPRETMRHMKELHFFMKINLNQQKVDAKIVDKNDEQVVSLNQFVNESVGTAADRLLADALAQGLTCVAELPDDYVAAVYYEERQKYEAEHPPEPERVRKKPFEIPPEQRQDWFIPEEIQIILMNRLTDMCVPGGTEYEKLKPRDRIMATRLLGQFCQLDLEQVLIDMRVHEQQPDLDLEKYANELHELNQKALKARRKEDEEFFKTHERNERPWPPRSKTEDCL
jgi:hypothetical protein